MEPLRCASLCSNGAMENSADQYRGSTPVDKWNPPFLGHTQNSDSTKRAYDLETQLPEPTKIAPIEVQFICTKDEDD